MKPNKKAMAILSTIKYLNLATVSDSGEPWNSPVFFACDEDYNFYWASSIKSQHSQNIHANGKVFITVYDSTVQWGKGVGVFILGSATEVSRPEEIAKACRLRKARVPSANQLPDDFSGDRPRRIYRATPQKIWMNEDGQVSGKFVDIRQEAGEL